MDSVKQILMQMPASLLKVIVLNGLVIGLVYFIVWKKLRKRFATRRIQLRERVDGKQIRREIKNALFTLSAGVLLSVFVLILSDFGYTKFYTDIDQYNKWWAYGGFFLLLLIDDTWFYWCHRLLHHPAIFRHVHREHHKSVDVNPFTSLSFHFLEPFLLSLWIIPVAFFIPIYAPVLGLLQIWGLFDNIKAHLGYEFYPRWWNRSWLRFMTSSTHHNMHHSKFNGNYGVHFRLWDKLLGTEFKDYEATFDEVHERDKL